MIAMREPVRFDPTVLTGINTQGKTMDDGSDRRRYASGEHQGAMEFLSAENKGRSRRNSLQQADLIHTVALAQDPLMPPRAFGRDSFEALTDPRGSIDARALLSQMHPTQELRWNPHLGGGRRQIRTGRNFRVPDRDDPNRHFNVRIHTNDNHRENPDENAFGHAIVRVEHVERVMNAAGVEVHHVRGALMGLPPVGHVGAPWVAHPNDAQANAAHIRARFGRRLP